MESQNKRYQEALKFIEYLIGELESSKAQNKSPKTKSKTSKRPVKESQSPQVRNNLNSFIGNRKIIRVLSNYYQAVSNVLKFKEIIEGKNYFKKLLIF